MSQPQSSARVYASIDSILQPPDQVHTGTSQLEVGINSLSGAALSITDIESQNEHTRPPQISSAPLGRLTNTDIENQDPAAQQPARPRLIYQRLRQCRAWNKRFGSKTGFWCHFVVYIILILCTVIFAIVMTIFYLQDFQKSDRTHKVWPKIGESAWKRRSWSDVW